MYSLRSRGLMRREIRGIKKLLERLGQLYDKNLLEKLGFDGRSRKKLDKVERVVNGEPISNLDSEIQHAPVNPASRSACDIARRMK